MRKPFLLRVEEDVLAALQRWAADELRSVNGQIEYLLRRELQQAGRLKSAGGTSPAAGGGGGAGRSTSGAAKRASK